jgi:hypothetical protein
MDADATYPPADLLQRWLDYRGRSVIEALANRVGKG